MEGKVIMPHSWSFTTGQLVLICFSSMFFGVCMTMIVMNIISPVHILIETIIYTGIALLMLMITVSILRQSRDALKQRYEIRRRMVGNF
ncbi:MAG: hypothetical protein ETSY2_20145 [Candidatus Entotheonella gemina]|uniref:Uncharacterized protein n=1 Tax=Candidatus Entotheonella gemina TaxID=1429439 RepID=W4M8H1_9BACT|nr:MAG: hypothetical protein ETSY2_20145 [Candidatus Entotheonella gemina]